MSKVKWVNDDGTRVTCSTEGCQSGAELLGMCRKHYQRGYKNGSNPKGLTYTLPDGTRMKCAVLDCDRDVDSRNLCSKHYQRVLYAEKPKTPRRSKWTLPDGTRMACFEEGCDDPVSTSGRCAIHYDRMLKKKHGKGAKPKSYCPIPGCGRVMASGKTICAKCNQFRWRYSLSYEKLIWLQTPENRVCSNLECRSTERLHLDHDHSCCDNNVSSAGHLVSCGKCVRGWLCGNCNSAMGLVGDDPARLQGLIDFLLANEKTPVV